MYRVMIVGVLASLAGGCFEPIEILSEEELAELRRKAEMREKGELDPSECVDDADYGLVGDECSAGLGQCERVDEYVCTEDGVVCGARAPSTARLSETCNNDIDDDCDGEVDEAPEGGCCLDDDCDGDMVCIDDRGGRCASLTLQTGGTLATGGATETGGIEVTGGMLATGGATESGGMEVTGGVADTGGATETGGMEVTGGVADTGGATETGGVCSGQAQCTGCSADADCGSVYKQCVNEACVRKPTCGDGFLDRDLGELCDDGNNQADDNCSADCTELTPYRINCDPSGAGTLGMGFCLISCDQDTECPRTPTAETGQLMDDLWKPVCAIPEWNLAACFIECDALGSCPTGYECVNPGGFTYGICGPAAS